MEIRGENYDLDIIHSSTGAGYLSVDMSHAEVKPLFQAYVSKSWLSQKIKKQINFFGLCVY